MNVMFSKQVQKINLLLSTTKEEPTYVIDSIGLVTNNIVKARATSKVSTPQSKPKYQSEIGLIKQEIPKKYVKIIEDLFKSKCQNLSIEVNQKNWQTFIRAFISKNKANHDDLVGETLNLNDFYFGQSCIKQINLFLQENLRLFVVKLNKNLINPNKLIRIETFKQLSLCNCKLGNDALEQLFEKLHESVIEKISLSSPQVKNRNQLTRYKKLISLIQKSTTLHTLELSNIQIQPDSMILQSCRNTSLKHIDISDNSNVKGISPSLLSLNLSRNGITFPFAYPMLPSELNYLNISYNKIPYYHFKEFLKCTYFGNLKQLILDHIKLDGDLSSLQYFLEQSVSLLRLSLVDCDLCHTSFINITHGVKHSRSLESVDLSRNKVPNEKIAESIAHMLQGCTLKEVKMKHCQIKDNFGQIIFRNIRKTKTLQKIDLMNNLLGDSTAKTICTELKYAKNLVSLLLDENIIKYKDMHEINSYLEGNKYFNVYQLDKQYHKLLQINNQILEANLIINSENEKLAKLQKETQQLQGNYIVKFKVENQEKKVKLKKQIYELRDQENKLTTELTIIQSLPSMTELNSLQSRRQSFLENHQSFNQL